MGRSLLLFTIRCRLRAVPILPLALLAGFLLAGSGVWARERALHERYILTVVVNGILPGQVTTVAVWTDAQRVVAQESAGPVMTGGSTALQFVLPAATYGITSDIAVGSPGESLDILQHIQLSHNLTIQAWPDGG